MANTKAVTEAKWNAVLLCLLRGLNQLEAAKEVGLGHSTVRRLYQRGFPTEPWGMTPLKIVVEQERAKARAMRARMTADAPPRDDDPPMGKVEEETIRQVAGAVTPEQREAAKADAIDARAQEGTMVQVARGNVIVLLSASLTLAGPLAQAAQAIVARVKRELAYAEQSVSRDPETGLETGGADPLKFLNLIRTASVTLKTIVETGHKAMEMERLLLGDPSGTGKLAQDAASMSDEDMLIELNNAAKVFGALERRGLRLVHGGRGVEQRPTAERPVPAPQGQPIASTSVASAKSE